jgi:hypothetical protein
VQVRAYLDNRPMATSHVKYAIALALVSVSTSGLSGCAHTERDGNRNRSAKQAQPERTGGEEPPAAAAQPRQRQPGELAAEPSRAIEDFMVDHFVIATWSRDVLISGDLEAVREPLTALAAYDYRSVAPGGWMSYVAKMQQAAHVTSSAQTLELAAIGVATMARTCAECHVATGRGPAFTDGEDEGAAQNTDTLGERMRRHMWAADRLWEGLTAPSEDSWTAGAAVLARAPSPAPSADPPLPPDYVAAIAEVRELGVEALDASTLEARAEVYGRFLASCAGCHALQVQYQF